MKNAADPSSFISAVRARFDTTLLEAGWQCVNDGGREAWIEALRQSCLVNDGGNYDSYWASRAAWYLHLTDAIAHLAMALSLDEKREKKVKREGLLLAAVIVSNSCQVEPPQRLEPFGKPCSGVTADGFDNKKGDRERMLALYKDRYARSGLPLCDCCATAATAVVRKSK